MCRRIIAKHIIKFSIAYYFLILFSCGSSNGTSITHDYIPCSSLSVNTFSDEYSQPPESGSCFSLDNTFGQGGTVTLDCIAGCTGLDEVNALAIDNKDRIYITGSTFNGKDKDIYIARFDPDGNLDPTFGNQGLIIKDLSLVLEDCWSEIAIDSDGNILVLGIGGKNLIIWKYSPSGDLVTSFGNNGIMNFTERAGRMGLDGTSIFVARDSKITKYDRFGNPDKSFGEQGEISYPISPYGDVFVSAFAFDCASSEHFGVIGGKNYGVFCWPRLA